MKEYTYDFHIHSCLSPCGDMEMTPNNIVNMAKIMECDIIAVTDHNSVQNARACMKIGESIGVTVVPGMELCTMEEAHVVCLFSTIEGAEKFEEYVKTQCIPMENDESIFGAQVIMDEDDEEIGREKNMLINSTFISVNDVDDLVKTYGGVAFPAHVDKTSYSVIASLGAIPPEANFSYIEITAKCDVPEFMKLHPETRRKGVLINSDAHYLENICENGSKIFLPECSAKAVVEKLSQVRHSHIT